MSYEPTYWNHKGKFEQEYHILHAKLVPSQGRGKTPHANALRHIANFYYKRYNDGCVLSTSARSVNRYAKKHDLDIHLFGGMTDKELDEAIDVIVEKLWELHPEHHHLLGFKTEIQWGTVASREDNPPLKYAFKTQGELDAFFHGIDAMDGWLEYQVV